MARQMASTGAASATYPVWVASAVPNTARRPSTIGTTSTATSHPSRMIQAGQARLRYQRLVMITSAASAQERTTSTEGGVANA